jgi:hypothetical protein
VKCATFSKDMFAISLSLFSLAFWWQDSNM